MLKRRNKVLSPQSEKIVESKIKRNIVLKLLINLGLEVVFFGFLFSSLLGLQTASICRKQVNNSQTKLEDIVEIVANNVENKNILVNQFDSLHSDKADTINLYLRQNDELLDSILEKKEGYLDTLKTVCAKENCDIECLDIYVYDTAEGKTLADTFYNRDESSKAMQFDNDYISQYVYDFETGTFRNTFIPFTYDHDVTGDPIIHYFDVELPENHAIYRYHGGLIKQDGTKYYLMLTGCNPRSLYDEVNSLISLQVIFNDATVGQNGYVFAIDNDGIIKSHPNPLFVGKKYSEVGLTESILTNNYQGWQTFKYGETVDKMFCVTAKMDEAKIREVLLKYNSTLSENVIQEVVRLYSSLNVSVACVSEAEINSNRISIAAIIGAIFVLVATIQIAYLLLVKEELLVSGKQISKKITKHLYINDTVAKRCAPVTAIGLIILTGLTIYAQCLFSLSSQIDNNNVYLNEIQTTLATNEEQTKNLKEETEDLYLNKLDVINYSVRTSDDIADLLIYTDPSTGKQSSADKRRSDIDEATRTRNKTYLATLADSMGVKNIYIFNLYGETIACSTSYQDFDLSTDSKDQSYAFWDVLKGHVTELVQDPMKSDVEGYMQYMAKPIYAVNEETYPDSGETYTVKEVVGMAQIGFEPNEYAQQLKVADIGNVLKNMIFEAKGFAFAINKSDNTIKYFPSSDKSIDYTGKSYDAIGLPKQALSVGYFGSVTLNGTGQWVSCNEYGDYYIYVAIPSSEVFSYVANLSVATGLISLVALTIFTLLYVLNPTDETLEAELVQKNRTFITIRDSSGKERKVVTADSRWGHATFKWYSLTAGQKLGVIIRVCSALFGILILIMMSTNLFDGLSIVAFIKQGKYTSGFNIFSATYAFFFGLVVFVIADVIKVLVRLALRNADARVETVGRLVTNMIKYAAVIWVIFATLSTFGVDTSSLITGASVLSIIVGLGSQSLISDILAGLFIVFEGEFRVGDIVTIGDWRGTVLEIGLRTTKIEDISKNIKILSNSSITGVVNMTKEYSYAVCTIGVEYGESIERVEAILSTELPLLKDKIPTIKDGPFYKGIDALNSSSVDIKILALCDEEDRIQLERDLNREMKLIFDKHDINVPFPQVVINPRVPEMTDGGASKKMKEKAQEFVEDQNKKSKGFE